ncbi:DUF4224 domain-containing protein [Xenorhabdus stockiae]|uniref:DUF4224 domain-containing protein n=1 Tax=Xenorhabdus stockiae TaxID=351614 RepID=UPI004064ABE5
MERHDYTLITDIELIELTGYQKPYKQCQSLEKAGIFFIKRPDGRPRTTWGHFNNPISRLSDSTSAEEPDFGAI